MKTADLQSIQRVIALADSVTLSVHVPQPPEPPAGAMHHGYMVHTRPEAGSQIGYDYLTLSDAVQGWIGHGTIRHEIHAVCCDFDANTGTSARYLATFLPEAGAWGPWRMD